MNKHCWKRENFLTYMLIWGYYLFNEHVNSNQSAESLAEVNDLLIRAAWSQNSLSPAHKPAQYYMFQFSFSWLISFSHKLTNLWFLWLKKRIQCWRFDVPSLFYPPKHWIVLLSLFSSELGHSCLSLKCILKIGFKHSVRCRGSSQAPLMAVIQVFVDHSQKLVG